MTKQLPLYSYPFLCISCRTGRHDLCSAPPMVHCNCDCDESRFNDGKQP